MRRLALGPAMFILAVLVSVALALVPASFLFEVHVPASPCDGFGCGGLGVPASHDGRGSCPIRMSAVVGFLGAGTTAQLSLPFRRGFSGLCQNVSIESIGGTHGSLVASSESEARLIGDEEVGLDVAVRFARETSSMQFVNVTYICDGGLSHYSVFNSKDGTVVAHVYRVGLMLLAQTQLVQELRAHVLLPFQTTSAQFFSDNAIPQFTAESNRTVARFDAVNVNSFSLAFSFDFDVYDQCSMANSAQRSVILKYAMIGGAIVGGIAIVAAVSWLIVKKVIKKKVAPPAFELLGADIDVVTDGDESQSDMETSRATLSRTSMEL